VLSREVRSLITRIAQRLFVVLISGRSRDDLIKRVDVPQIIYAGNHGFDISGAMGLHHQVAADFIPRIEQAAARLQEETGSISGVIIEEKGFSVAVHYRLVARWELPALGAVVEKILETVPGLEARYGKKVVELRPAVDWDKGDAVTWIRDRLEDGGSILPLYIGDDLTDEDAFRAVGRSGISILVSHRPRPTLAHYSLRDVREVKEVLERLLGQFGELETN
jgi:trehalose-phosphatase